MKTILFTMAAASMLIAGTMFTGCDTSAEKVDEAQENVAEAKDDLKEAQHEENRVVEETEMQQAWKVYKTDMNEKIAKNKETIAELKVKMKKPGKMMDAAYAKRIENLEAKNEDLRTRLDEFENNQSDWDKFKREFDHDMNELGTAFTELGTDSKK